MTDTLAPRAPRPGRTRRRRWVPATVALAVVAAVVWLVWNLFTGTLYFYTADQAIEQRASLGDDRFTLEGTPVGCSIVSSTQGSEVVTAFTIAFEGALIDVVHRGEPAELFEGGTPVVLDGSWVHADPDVVDFTGLAHDGWYFSSDRMRVKHDNDYINDPQYEERIAEAAAAAGSGDCSL